MNTPSDDDLNHDPSLFEPPYPDPECLPDRKYRARVLSLLIAVCVLVFAGIAWLIGLLITAFT